MTAGLESSPAVEDNVVVATFETQAAEKTDNNGHEAQPPPPQLPPTDMLYYTYEGNSLTSCHARVLSIQEKTTTTTVGDSDYSDDVRSQKNDDRHGNIVDVCLDQTILHAQGGGQPTDFGSLRLLVNNNNDNNSQEEGETANANDDGADTDNDAAVIIVQVDKVLMDRTTGIATHTGRLLVGGGNHNRHRHHLLLKVGDTVQVTVDEERRQILSECHTAGHGVCVYVCVFFCIVLYTFYLVLFFFVMHMMAALIGLIMRFLFFFFLLYSFSQLVL